MSDEMIVRRHSDLVRDVKALGKKYRSVAQDLIYAERLLAIGQSIPETTPYPGFGIHRIYKTRVVNTSIPYGKSKGYRLIYELVVVEEDESLELVFLYDHTTCSDEAEVKREVRTRLGL